LKELEKGFSSRLDIKKLKGTRNHYRIRVGNYRILLAIEYEMAYVYDISHRGSVYK
jgi:mRNA-degrading endonuclease RelE of RelBE toxin-antitoxin system